MVAAKSGASAGVTGPDTEACARTMAEILVLVAHPAMAASRITRRLMQAAARVDGPASAPRTEVRDLYALYPDYLIDTAAEQAALAPATLVVWLHPIHWYGMPPLMKLWLDEVLAWRWAYGPGGHALQSKHLWLVCSTGGPAEAYSAAGVNREPFDAFLPPYRQTAALTGMHWLPPLVLHGAHRVDEAALAAHAEHLVRRLHTWPAWQREGGQPPTVGAEVPAGDRPGL
jgi:glutathione-regulated potassium-efflux system ancillary protein KefF